jgi:predicted RNA-binding protein with PIN domain
MIYILDGYNIVKQVEQLENKELKVQRDWLIKILIEKKPQGGYKNKVLVVFDGKYEIGVGKCFKFKNYNIEVYFTSLNSADDEIKKIVKNAKNKKEIVVVSDDKEVCRFVSYYGAKVLGVKEFLSRINKNVRQKSNTVSQDKMGISFEDMEEINKEIKKYFNI